MFLFGAGVDKNTAMCQGATYAICTLNTISKVVMWYFYIERREFLLPTFIQSRLTGI